MICGKTMTYDEVRALCIELTSMTNFEVALGPSLPRPDRAEFLCQALIDAYNQGVQDATDTHFKLVMAGGTPTDIHDGLVALKKE